jgi:hypothetical protein
MMMKTYKETVLTNLADAYKVLELILQKNLLDDLFICDQS